MKDQSKTKQVLIQELVSLRQRVAELEQSESERKRVDDALRLDSEILANMREGIQLTRIDDGVIVYTNRSFELLFGYDPGELVGNHVSILNAPGAKSPVDVANEIIKSLNRTGVWNGEIHNLRKDGTSFWCYVNISKFEYQQYGEVWISVHQDITERKRAEEALKKTYEQVRSLASRLQEVREETRTRISHDIHDELGGSLAGLKMNLLRLEPIVSGVKEREKRQAMLDIINEAKECINYTIQSTRRIVMEQRPSVLDDFGLVAAMEWQLGELKTHSDISFEFNVGQIKIDINKNLATVVFRIFQEALSNVIRHSKATEAYISLQVDEGQLILEIKDNGRGITEDELTGTGSIGILGMRERALAFGGELNISGEPGKGSTLHLKMPIQ